MVYWDFPAAINLFSVIEAGFISIEKPGRSGGI
jgi:hypothetical protein